MRPGTSAYKGIYWHKVHGRWLVEEHVHIGEFETLDEAFAAYVTKTGRLPVIRTPRRLPVERNPLAYEDAAPPAPTATRDPRFGGD